MSTLPTPQGPAGSFQKRRRIDSQGFREPPERPERDVLTAGLDLLNVPSCLPDLSCKRLLRQALLAARLGHAGAELDQELLAWRAPHPAVVGYLRAPDHDTIVACHEGGHGGYR